MKIGYYWQPPLFSSAQALVARVKNDCVKVVTIYWRGVGGAFLPSVGYNIYIYIYIIYILALTSDAL